MRTLILSTFLYACESWTLTAEIERRIQALEMRCYRRLLNISYKDHVTNQEVRNRIQNATGVHDDLLTMVKKRKLRWYGHISRSSDMAKTILQGTVKGARRRGRQKKRWEDNIKEWTGMGFGDSLRAAEDREGWKGIVAASSVVPRRPPRLRDWESEREISNDKYKIKKMCFSPWWFFITINIPSLEDFWLIIYTQSLFSLEIGTETMFQTDLYQSSLSVYKVNNVAPSKG